MSELQQVGRLAMRVEGSQWVAYYAKSNTMEGALRLGSLHMNIARHPKRKQEFMDFMREVVSDLLEVAVGRRPEWPDAPRPAPEHEKAGSA